MEMRKELRDITLRRMEEYVSSISDAEKTVGGFRGRDWELELTELPPVAKGAMTMARVDFVLTGSETSVERVWKSLEYKLLRGGA
jgi:hypothetical protein